MIITAKMNREFRACYSDSLLAELYGPDGKTHQEVATLKSDRWSDVSLRDRVWILHRVLHRQSRSRWLEYLARLTERSLGRVKNPDRRSVAVIAALRADKLTRSNVCDAASATAAYASNTDFAASTAYAAAVAAAIASTSAASTSAASTSAASTSAAAASAHAAAVAAAIASAAAASAHAAAAAADADDERKQQLNDLVELIR